MIDFVHKIDRGIRFSFYALFFITPLVLYPKTFELFEFNKLWFVFALSVIILFLWVSKMIVVRKFIFKRTPFDIPIALFLLSQIISTIFSIDPHVSFWGYYSRFNGGLLSLTAYIFLYYAFVSNFSENSERSENRNVRKSDISNNQNNRLSEFSEYSENISYKLLLISLLSGLTVALWGFTSHFGYDFTCLIFRGSFDVSCWTDAFQPTVRMFSTLGQPNWLAAYFSILIPVALAIGIFKFAYEKSKLPATCYLLLAILLFVETLWTGSQSGYLGLLSGLLVFTAAVGFFFFQKKSRANIQPFLKPLAGVLIAFMLLSFFLGNPIASKLRFTSFNGLTSLFPHAPAASPSKKIATPPAEELGGSDSGKIRLVVWTGAIKLFQQHPFFGTGPETFAYAYYSVKPIEHNLLSEWDYLYNKAHNEYLNYLATTGIFGLGTYLLMVGWFLWYSIKYLLSKNYKLSLKNHSTTEHTSSMIDARSSIIDLRSLLTLALLSSYISILVSNFFGFSVVVINMYMFFIPALALGITLPEKKKKVLEEPSLTPVKLCGIIIVGIICLWAELMLLNFWFADQDYSTGYNLNRAQQYVEANRYLESAAKLYPGEDLYKNELSLNLATLALLSYQQKQAEQGSVFLNRAIQLSDEVIKKHPYNVVFYKTRIQTMFELSQINESYYSQALDAIKEARKLAPTDAKIAYNQGLLYGQKGDLENAIKNLRESIVLKPNYREPRYALASYLIEKAKKETDPGIKQKLLDQARETLAYSLQNINADDPQTKELLKSLE